MQSAHPESYGKRQHPHQMLQQVNFLQAIFNQCLDEYQENSPFSGDVHASVNVSLRMSLASLKKPKNVNPLGAGRPWSQVEKELVSTFNDFTKEFVRQAGFHFGTYNKFISRQETDFAAGAAGAAKATLNERKIAHLRFVAREELAFWQEFPRGKKFYHDYLRKIYTIFNQCRMPDALRQDNLEQAEAAHDGKKHLKVVEQQKQYIRDIQLIIALCLDLMPQASQDYNEKIESPQPLSSLIQNVWELTDSYTQTVLSNESKESRDTDGSPIPSQLKDNSQHGEAILSGGNLMSFVVGMGGKEGKNQDIEVKMDKEARHLRKFLYQNRKKFDNVVEELKMFDADNHKNWQILGNVMTMMISDVIQILLSTQENIKISYGLIEAMMTYSSFFSKTQPTVDSDYYQIREQTIFDVHQGIIQYQWAQIFGQISKLSDPTFSNCLGFINQALINDHKMMKSEEVHDLAEQIYHGRFLNIQPSIQDFLTKGQPAKPHSQSQSQKASKVINLFNEILSYLQSQKISNQFKQVLLKTCRHLIAQLNFRDAIMFEQSNELKQLWQNGITKVYHFVDGIIIRNVFPEVSSINLNKKVSSSHWDQLLESPFNQHVLLLIIQIIKVSEESFYNQAFLRLMNWICLPQMLRLEKTHDLACRILLELYTPELYKVSKFMHWQPKILNHIFFLEDREKDFFTPVVSHIDLQVFNQMAHRSPSLLCQSYRSEAFADNLYKQSQHADHFGITIQETFPSVFERKFLDPAASSSSGEKPRYGSGFHQSSKRATKFLQEQYLDLAALYDFEFLQSKIIPQFVLGAASDESAFAQELLLLALNQAHKALDPSQNFRQKYLTVHAQIGERFQNQMYVENRMKVFEKAQEKLKSFIESAVPLIVKSPLFHGKFIHDTMDFFQSSQYREQCTDRLDIIWPSPSLSVMKESEYVSKFLKKNGFAEHLLDINQSLISFEDHVEIQGHHFEDKSLLDPNGAAIEAMKRQMRERLECEDPLAAEQYDEAVHGRYDDFMVIANEQYDQPNEENRFNNYFADQFDGQAQHRKPPEYCLAEMNKIVANVNKQLGSQWDKKKEHFIRRRLTAYLLEDRSQQASKSAKESSKKKGEQPGKDSWLNDSQEIKDKQITGTFGEHPCLKRQLHLEIRQSILKMIHYLPRILDCPMLSRSLCKDLLHNEKNEGRDEILELTDQVQAAQADYAEDEDRLPPEIQSDIDQLEYSLREMAEQYNREKNLKASQEKQPASQVLGGTYRLTRSKYSHHQYHRLKNIQQSVLAYGLLSVDFKTCSKTSKMLQKLMVFGSVETKVAIIDQIIYILKELMVEQSEDFHMPMYLQLLVSCIRLWHHNEIQKLRRVREVAAALLDGVPFVSIESTKRNRTRQQRALVESAREAGAPATTYPEMPSLLYIFDLMDATSLIGMCNKDKMVRSLSLILVQESSKLKRLIAGHDNRKSLAELIYSNEMAIRDRIAERVTLTEMFKHKTSKPAQEAFTRTYDRRDIDQIIYGLSFFKIIEDSFDYKQAKINESLARDIGVQYIGELATLWKNEFKNLLISQKQSLKATETKHSKLRRQHRILGLKLMSFIFNLSRRTLLLFEQRMDALKQAEKADAHEGSEQQVVGPRINQLNRREPQHSSLLDCSRDHTGFNLLGALTLYNVTISSYTQMDPNDILDFEDDNFSKKDADMQGQAFTLPPSKLAKLQDDLFNFVQSVNMDPADYLKVPSGGSSFHPSKLPVSSIMLSFLFLIQSPLPLATSGKRALIAIHQARERAGLGQVPASLAESQKAAASELSCRKEVQNIIELEFKSIKDIFSNDVRDNIDGQYLINSALFYSLLLVCSDSLDGDQLTSETAFLVKRCQLGNESLDLARILGILADMIAQLHQGQKQQQAVDVVRAVLYNGLTKIVKLASDQWQSLERPEDHGSLLEYLPAERQREIADFCHQNNLSQIHDWLIHKNRQSYMFLLQFQDIFQKSSVANQSHYTHARSQGSKVQNQPENPIQLDLEYLISMQNLGYDVLKYYRFEHNGQERKVGLPIKEQMVQGVNEMKMLINSVYQFYRAQEDFNELVQTTNPFYECFLEQIISQENQSEQQKFLKLLKENRFKPAYEQLTKVCFNLKYPKESAQQPKRMLIDAQVKKFCQYNMHSKFFLLSFSMVLCLRGTEQSQISQIERSRLICLATLPLMFDDEEFREQVEEKISNMPDLEQLIQADNKDFFRLIKSLIKDEEVHSLHNQFERYFSISGFIRNLLNEIIKLQTANDQRIYASNYMLIKILDTLTYFVSQKNGSGLLLRRAPRSKSDQSNFLFDHLIDYKSFEFLQKLFKITEKLIEYDQDMVIMNMWFKLVENQRSNYEILAKFLIHNLSAFMVKLKAQATTQASQADQSLRQNAKGLLLVQDNAQYGIEFEKQRRYSINIFNYIKVRVQRADIRNSIQVSPESPSWSKKMIELLQLAQLNLQSKYVLEKVKLKKILQTMHREINQTSSALRLKGGLDTEVLVMQLQEPTSGAGGRDASNNIDDPVAHGSLIQQSVRLSQLLESQTFLSAFSANKRKESSILHNLLFNFRRIIKEKFVKITPVNQLNQFNELLIKYLENSILLIANDTDRQLQVVKFSKEEELALVVVILILIGHLMMNHSEVRFRHLVNIFKTLQSNIPSLQPFFYLNTLSPRQLILTQGKNVKDQRSESKFSERMFTILNYKTNLFDCFDQFTCVFFSIASNISCDSELRVNMMDLYLQIFKGLKEVQRQKRNNLEEDEDFEAAQGIAGPRISQSMSFIQSGRKLRRTILTMMQSAFFNIHELASVRNKIVQVNQSQASLQSSSSQSPSESRQVYNLSKNFRQHVQIIMDYVLFSSELDRLKQQNKKNQSSSILGNDTSPAGRQIVYASNTLFWLGIVCLEAPNHLYGEIEEIQLLKPLSQMQNPYLIQVHQIQYFGILTIRRTLEETNFLKILIVYQRLSNHFYSYSLQMQRNRQSLMNVLFDAMRNPLCTRDVLKVLSISIRIQDSRLLVGQMQPMLDESSGEEKELSSDHEEEANLQSDRHLKKAMTRVELIRLLYLIPFIMQQFLAPTNLGSSDDLVFQNKRNMISLLKRCLPTIGIDKKRGIMELLEEIQQSKTGNEEGSQIDGQQELSQQVEQLIKLTVDLIYEKGFRRSLVYCLRSFQILQRYYVMKYGPQQSDGGNRTQQLPKQNNDQPIKTETLNFIIDYIQEVMRDEDIEQLSKQVEKKKSQSIFNDSVEILGEEVANYRTEFRALYFGLKNIITKEIEAMDKDVDVSQFFDYDASASAANSAGGQVQPVGRASDVRSSRNKFSKDIQDPRGPKQISNPPRKQQQAQGSSASGKRSRAHAHRQGSGVTAQMQAPPGGNASRFNLVPAAGNSQQSNLMYDPIAMQPGTQSQHKLDEKKYTHSPTQRQRLKNQSANSSTLPQEAESSAVQHNTSSIPDNPVPPHSAKPTTSRLIRPVGGAALDARSGRSRSKSHTRYEQYEDDEEENGSQKVQITDVPQIQEGTPLLRRGTRREEHVQEVKEQPSPRDSSFAELTKQQTLIQQSFQSHHTAAVKSKELGQSPQVALMNNFVAEQAEAIGAGLNEDLLTFQQKRRPTQQTQPRSKMDDFEGPSHLLKMQTMLPTSRFEEQAEQSAPDQQLARQQNQRSHRVHGFGQSGSHQKAYNEPVEVEVELDSQQRRFYHGSINPGDNGSQSSKHMARTAQTTVLHQDQAYRAIPRNQLTQQEVMNQQPFMGYQTQQFDDPRVQARPQTSDIMRQHNQKYGGGQGAQYATMAHQYQQMPPDSLSRFHGQASYGGQAHPATMPRSGASNQALFKDPTPAAMKPNYVADRSNQIWSEVASQKSQDLREYDPRGARPNEQWRGHTLNQSEQSFKSFTQTSVHRKYDKNEPNFDFRTDPQGKR